MAEPLGREQNRDLVLAPGEFAFVLDATKGLVNVLVGPMKSTMSDNDRPVLWDTTDRRFKRAQSVESAVQTYLNAPEGYYVVLENPAVDGKDGGHPRPGTTKEAAELQAGRKINAPGPAYFPLWPGQSGRVIEGHQLRSNEYLLVRVYNDEQATANWGSAVVKRQAQSTSQQSGEGGEAKKPEESATSAALVAAKPPALTMGQLIVIKGTDVSFYIPPTGVEVLREEGGGAYVRSAITLERLEYCILRDEDGNKRYVQGPAVVFPEPTETFVKNDEGERKFRALELNDNSGIHVKVIAEYKEGDREFKVGEELFITGARQAIYYPRVEHAIIAYGDQKIHHAVAVPAGEGRYVLDRMKGEVRLVTGPKMLLPNPINEVIVRRVLDSKTVSLLFPNNPTALEVNEALSEAARGLSSGEYLSHRELASRSMSQPLRGRGADESFGGDSIKRKTSFTQPRTVTLDTKYEGAVAVDVWTGYAVLVVKKTGERRVVVGPGTILLEYDETLAPMELSTGTPKTDRSPLRTVYLRVANNKVSDVVQVETKDLCPLDLTVSYRVNFEGDSPEKWFAVENYVQFLVEHLRSLIRNAAKQHTVEEFYGQTANILRNVILGNSAEGAKRKGRLFEENGMSVYDVEVLEVKINNASVANLLTNAQGEALKATLAVAGMERELSLTARREEVKRKTREAEMATLVAEQERKREVADAEAETAAQKLANDKNRLEAETELALTRISAEVAQQVARNKARVDEQKVLDELNAAELAREKAKKEQELEFAKKAIEQELAKLVGETEQFVKRTGAVDDKLIAALQAFGDKALVEKLASSMAPLAILGGTSVAEIIQKMLAGTPLEGVLSSFREKK